MRPSFTQLYLCLTPALPSASKLEAASRRYIFERHVARHGINSRIYVKRGLAICLLALGILSLQGCGSIEVALGLRTRLDKLPVTALSASLSPAPALAPGKSGRLIITATTSDGKQLITVGPGHGKVLFDSFTFDASVVQVSKKGKVSLPADPRQSDTQMPHIRITANGHPYIVADLDVLYTVGDQIANSDEWPDWYDGNEFRAIRDKEMSQKK